MSDRIDWAQGSQLTSFFPLPLSDIIFFGQHFLSHVIEEC